MQDLFLTFTSDRERKTSDDILRTQLDYIAKRGISGNRGRGWDYELLPIEGILPSTNNSKWRFTCTIRFYRRVDIDPTRFRRQSSEIVEWASAAGHHVKFGPRKWIAVPPPDITLTMGINEDELAEINEEVEDDYNESLPAETKTEEIKVRITPSLRQQMDDLRGRIGQTSISDLVRDAIEYYLEQPCKLSSFDLANSIVGRLLLNLGPDLCTWSESYPEAYQSLQAYRPDMIEDVKHILEREMSKSKK